MLRIFFGLILLSGILGALWSCQTNRTLDPTQEPSSAGDSNTGLSEPTTESESSAFSPGSIVISEIGWCGGRSNSGGVKANAEFVEFYNPGSVDLVLDGLSLYCTNDSGGGSVVAFPSGLTIPATGFLVLGKNSQDFLTVFRTTEFAFFLPVGLSLANSGFFLVLADSHGTVLDRVNASPSRGGFAPAGSSTHTNRTMARNWPLGDGDHSTNWQASESSVNVDAGYADLTRGTPGAKNERWP